MKQEKKLPESVEIEFKGQVLCSLAYFFHICHYNDLFKEAFPRADKIMDDHFQEVEKVEPHLDLAVSILTEYYDSSHKTSLTEKEKNKFRFMDALFNLSNPGFISSLKGESNESNTPE